jgi:ElaB/YqjD/DUF883 family membrane-anchored ribosome-binding protein
MAMEILEKQQATVEDVLREVSKIKSIVRDAVDDGMKSAIKTMRRGREAAEDAIDAAEDALDDAKRAVKQNPLEAVGIVFAVGVVVGCLTAWSMRRR